MENRLKNGIRLHDPKHAPKLISSLAQSCWLTNPNDRPTFTELKEKINFCYRQIVVAQEDNAADKENHQTKLKYTQLLFHHVKIQCHSQIIRQYNIR